MKQTITLIRAFIKKEITQILRDKRMRFVLFVAPLAQLIIFGVALSSESRNMKLAIYSPRNDIVLNDIYKKAIGSSWFINAKVTTNDPYEWIKSGEAEVVLVSKDHSVDASDEKGKGEIQVLINAQNSSRAEAIESYLLNIVKSDNRQNLPIKFSLRALYNPTFKTSNYMVPGVLSMLVCLVTILLTSMSLAKEKELGTIETLISAPIKKYHLILGKTLPFVVLGAIQAPLILIFAVLVFKVPVQGPIIMLIISTLLMIIGTVAIGLLISTMAKNQQQAMLGGFIYLFPSYLLSGLMFPIENMPFIFKPFAYINPLTHYMGLLRNILLIGGDVTYFIRHSVFLLLIATFVLIIALNRFKNTI